MKVTLDLTQLLAEGKITQAEFDKLVGLAAAGTGSLAFNILIGFGVIAVSGSLIALVPNPTAGIVIGTLILGTGLAFYALRAKQWEVLAHMCVLVGALMLGGGLIILSEASVWSFLLMAAGFAAAGIIARSSLLIALSVLALSSSIGARTGYEHATYFLGIEEPTATIGLFAAVAIGTFQLSKFLPSDYERLAINAARTSVFLVNFGFWIGSLWGDEVESLPLKIDDWVFALLWAAALIATGVWAAMQNRRWVVNIVAVFGAIHFYTQWFELLGPNPLSILLGGLIALGFALALWYFNRQLWEHRAPAPVSGPS